VLLDDDTAVNATRLRSWLRSSGRAASKILYAGATSTTTSLFTVTYVGGGPGMVLSREAVRRLKLELCGLCVDNIARCRVLLGGKAHGNQLVPACNIYVGACAALFGVNATHVPAFLRLPPWWDPGDDARAAPNRAEFISFYRAKPADYVMRYFSTSSSS